MAGWSLLVLTIILVASSDAQDCRIENINIAEKGADEATITWRTAAQCDKSNIERYEVIWSHAKYKACRDGRKDKSDSAIGSKEVVITKAVINGLRPFSIYDITIKTTTKDGSQIEAKHKHLETEMDVPDTKPRLSPANGRYERAINFIWLDPEESECIHQNGRQDGYEVELLGLDPWHSGKIEQKYNQTVDTYLAQNLMPYTSYMLKVYSKNIGGLVNFQIPLEIQERTLETQPLPPTNLTAKAVSEQSIHISWNPSYPPTGLIRKYELAIGTIYNDSDNQIVWNDSVEVGIAHQGACIGEKKRRSATLSNSFCYVFYDLNPGSHYAFRIKAYNKNVESPSVWSEVTDVWTESRPDIIIPGVTPTPSAPDTSSQPSIGFSNTTIITVLCLAAGIVLMGVIVTALVYKLKIIRLKQQIRNEETWNQNRTVSQSSSYLPGASTSTQMTDTYLTSLHSQAHSEIQSRRLPEPPPVRNRADTVTQDPRYAEAYELASLPSYLDMTSSSRRESAASPSELESTRIQEECTDIDGYLRPTFPIPSDLTPIRPGQPQRQRTVSQTDSDYVSESQDVPSLICPESYVAPDTIRHEIQPPYLVTDSRLLSGQNDCERVSPGRRSQNSLNFDRSARLSSHRSEASVASSKRSSPSEPLISISKAVDV